MVERKEAVNFKGALRSVIGPQLKAGDKAPGFKLMAQDLTEIEPLEQAKGKIKILTAMPSLDTGVCDKQTRRFNVEAAALGDKVAIVAISVDLPFAQKRWCGAAEIKGMTVASDYMNMSFGDAYGTHIKDFRLEQRSVFVVDQNDVIRHAEYVVATGNEPDYEAALKVVRDLAK